MEDVRRDGIDEGNGERALCAKGDEVVEGDAPH